MWQYQTQRTIAHRSGARERGGGVASWGATQSRGILAWHFGHQWSTDMDIERNNFVTGQLIYPNIVDTVEAASRAPEHVKHTCIGANDCTHKIWGDMSDVEGAVSVGLQHRQGDRFLPCTVHQLSTKPSHLGHQRQGQRPTQLWDIDRVCLRKHWPSMPRRQRLNLSSPSSFQRLNPGSWPRGWGSFSSSGALWKKGNWQNFHFPQLPWSRGL